MPSAPARVWLSVFAADRSGRCSDLFCLSFVSRCSTCVNPTFIRTWIRSSAVPSASEKAAGLLAHFLAPVATLSSPAACTSPAHPKNQPSSCRRPVLQAGQEGQPSSCWGPKASSSLADCSNFPLICLLLVRLEFHPSRYWWWGVSCPAARANPLGPSRSSIFARTKRGFLYFSGAFHSGFCLWAYSAASAAIACSSSKSTMLASLWTAPYQQR